MSDGPLRPSPTAAEPAIDALIGPWVDQFNPAARAIRWKDIAAGLFDFGVDAWWQDCTEPGDDGNALSQGKCFLGPASLYRNAYPLRGGFDAWKAAQA